MRLFIIFLITPIIALTQTSFKGIIINSKTKAGVSFATVGLIKENIGTNADEEGRFTLTSGNRKQNDTLLISCVGYGTLKIPADNLSSNISIPLNEQESKLAEVIISAKNNWTFATLNDFSNCGNNYVGSNGYQTQLAQHFQASTDNSYLTEIKICRMSLSIFDPEKTIFRIRIYDMDTKTKAPSSDLCDEVIEVKTKIKFINLNLEKYKINIPNKDFFVAIEWLKIPYNENKTKTKLNGKEFEYIHYTPSIGWTDTMNEKMEAWMLDYRNVWHPMFKMPHNKTSLSISATIKY